MHSGCRNTCFERLTISSSISCPDIIKSSRESIHSDFAFKCGLESTKGVYTRHRPRYNGSIMKYFKLSLYVALDDFANSFLIYHHVIDLLQAPTISTGAEHEILFLW